MYYSTLLRPIALKASGFPQFLRDSKFLCIKESVRYPSRRLLSAIYEANKE